MKGVSYTTMATPGDEVLLPIEPTQERTLGAGYDVLTDQHSDGIVVQPRTGFEVRTAEGESGQRITVDADVIEDTQEFRETLNVSISAAARGFGGKGSASYSLYREVKINSNDVFALIYVSVVNATQIMKDPVLTESARTEWNNQAASARKQAFVRAFGDSYISSVTTGGEFLALFILHTSSRSEKERVRASASASFASFKASGSYEKLTEFFNSHKRTSLKFFRNGGEGKWPEMTVEALLAAAREFPDLVNPTKGGKPKQIFFTAKPINKVADPQTNIDLRARKASELIEDIGRFQAKLSDRLNDARFAISEPSLFKQVDTADLDEMARTLEQRQIEASRIAVEVAERRFEDVKDVVLLDYQSLPKPPQADSGKSIPLIVRLTVWDYGAKDLEGKDGEWLQFGSLLGVSVEAPQLPRDLLLQYRVCDQRGSFGEQWSRAGETAKAPSSLILSGIQMRIDGANADRYSIQYAIKAHAFSGSFYERDGSVARMSNWHITGFKVSLLLS